MKDVSANLTFYFTKFCVVMPMLGLLLPFLNSCGPGLNREAVSTLISSSSDTTDSTTDSGSDSGDSGGGGGGSGGSVISEVSVGLEHVCVARNNVAKCIGSNRWGKLGNDSYIHSASAWVDVSNTESQVTSVSVAPRHTCIEDNNKGKCFGYNDNGSLGTGSSTTDIPQNVFLLASSVVDITAGGGFSSQYNYGCASVSTETYCWGNNNFGQLGEASNTNRLTPTTAVSGIGSAEAISTGGYGTTCLVEDGGILCFGNNEQGQLGDGTTTNANTPVTVNGIGTNSGATQTAVGLFHACGIVDNAVKCWGDNQYGQLGDGTTTDSLTPVDALVLTGNVTAITAGWYHTCAIMAGELYCWGRNDISGAIGDGTQTNQSTPTKITSITGTIDLVSAGPTSTCATVDDTLYCWGSKLNGVDASGTDLVVNDPVAATGLGSNFDQVTVGFESSCTVDSGAAKCWGYNHHGTFGNGSQTPSNTLQTVTGLTSGVTDMDVTWFAACAVVSGAARCWGQNYKGVLGTDPTTQTQSLTPQSVNATLDTGATAIGISEIHGCAIKSGEVYCWGNNISAAIGNGAQSDTFVSATKVGGLGASVTVLEVGLGYNCVIDGGAALCWGLNSNGQLGDGTTNTQTSATAVTGLTSGVTKIDSGGAHTCAIHSGALKCWGLNDAKQVGQDAVTSFSSPQAVSVLTAGVTDVSTNSKSTCAIMGGRVYCFGDNSMGQLGNGSTGSSSSTPTVISSIDGATEVATSFAKSTYDDSFCVIINNGDSMKCWGYLGNGQLGTVRDLLQTSPTQAVSF